MVGISSKVGDWNKGSINMPDDVETVQELLKAASEKERRPDFDPGDIDRKISRHGQSSTVKAISAFQSAKMGNADGAVDPGNKTIGLLASYESDVDSFENIFDPLISWAATFGQCFPFEFVPAKDYHKGGIKYGAKRRVPRDKSEPLKGYRKHAACDLIAPEGTRVHAVDDGKIIGAMKHFYRGTYSIEVQHTHFVVRYCEIKGVAAGLGLNDTVKKGDVIAYVGRMHRSSMLHFEMYAGTCSGPLTNKGQKLGKTPKNGSFQRRADIIDPTLYLDRWKHNLPLAP